MIRIGFHPEDSFVASVCEAMSDININDIQDDVSVDIFTATEQIKKHHLRVASHRLVAPEWVESPFTIAVADNSEKPETIAEYLWPHLQFIASWRLEEAVKRTPWGQLPEGEEGFRLYKEWLKKHFQIEAESIGLYQPVKLERFSLKEVPICLPKQFVRDFARSVELLPKIPDKYLLFEVAAGFAKTYSNNSLELTPGEEAQKFFELLWSLKKGQEIAIIVPVCPAWSHDNAGYNFETIFEEETGISYQLLIEGEGLQRLIALFENFGGIPQVIIEVPDIEWFDIEEGHYPTMAVPINKEEFMEIIAGQCQLIEKDLAQRGIKALVRSSLQLVGEEAYLQEAARQKEQVRTALEKDTYFQNYFQYLLSQEQRLYEKQLGIRIDFENPQPMLTEAVVDDIRLYKTEVALLSKKYQGKPFLFLVENDPFKQLYHGVPRLAWRVPRKGAF